MATATKFLSSPWPSPAALLSSSAMARARCHCCALNASSSSSRTPQLSSNGPDTQLQAAPTAHDDAFKVFVDDSTGVICYRSEGGEVVCEGLDEGTHFDPKPNLKDGLSNVYVPEDQAAEILPLLGQPMYEI